MKITFKDFENQAILNQWELTASQEKFWKSDKRVVLFSGGYGCGKSLMLVLKAIEMAIKHPGNFILMGRQTYVEIKDSLWKEFLNICPDHLVASVSKAEMRIVLINKSEIIFRHLDKVSEKEIKSMNLGCAFIDQAEDLSKPVFLGIKGRLRREGVTDGDRRIYMTMNPELTWHYADFKQNPQPENELIESSTLENKDNLPAEYIKDLMNYPENYKRQYVYGIWDESLLSGNTVFSREDIEKMSTTLMSPQEEIDGLKIYAKWQAGHRYQMGIDVAEGSEEETEHKDKSTITIADLTMLEEAAHWSGQVPPDVVAEKAIKFARFYQNKNSEYCVVVPEMNSIGLTLVNRIKKEDDILLYQREEFDKSVGKRLKKLGWRTTRQSKPLLVNHFQELLRLKNPKLRTRETLEEIKTFIWTADAKKSGMGAKTGFHDDRIISFLLAFFEPGEVKPGKILSSTLEGGKIKLELTPSIVIKNNKAHFSHLQPRLEAQNKWTTH